jgi:hypothetical protein
LIAGEAASATYYETTGWRGVVERETGPLLSARFPSEPGAAFPVYHVLADLCRDPRAEARLLSSSAPLQAQALALRSDGRDRLLVANMEAREQTVRVVWPRGVYRGRSLDLETVATAAATPARFRESRSLSVDTSARGEAELTLGAYAVVTLEESA